MVRNYFKIAWRNITKHKVFSVLNIVGLALSMSVCLIIMLLYQDGYNYDKFHVDADRIYRVNTLAIRKGGSTEPYASSPTSVGKQIVTKFAWVEKTTSLEIAKPKNNDNPFGSQSDVIIRNNQRFGFNGKVADHSFFEIFNFKLAAGDIKTALNEPNTVVISAELSKKLFNNQNPINSTIEIANRGLYTITGILQPFIGKTHFEFEALLSPNSQEKASENITNYNTTYTYIKLRPNTDVEQAKASINTFFAPLLKNLSNETKDASLSFDLQPLSEITPGYSIANAMGKGLPKHLLWVLALMGFVVMASAIFNYTNLTLAKSLGRAKEIGIRKVFGAKRGQVVNQIMGEGIVISFIALVVSIGFLWFFKNELNKLQSFSFFDLDVSLSPLSIAYFIVFAVVIGLIAGVLPAFTISKLNPVDAIRKIENLRIFKRIGFGKTLLVLQYIFTMLFIMIVSTLHKQIEYAVNMDYGFRTDQIYNVELQGISIDAAKSKFSKIAGVEQISAMDIPIGTYNETSIDIKINKSEETYKKVQSYSVDKEMIPNLDLTIIAGENFPSKPSQNNKNPQVIVNEIFAEEFKLGNADVAVGKSVYLNDSTAATVIGVVKDFLFKPADYSLKPLMLRNDPSEWNLVNIKLNSHRAELAISDLEKAWKELAPGYVYQGEFYNTTIQKNYTILNDVNKVIQFFALIGIVIGLLGLLGMTIISVEKRQKEISVRKILGATEKDIAFILSKGFLKLLLIGFAVAIPFGLYLSDQILNNFANRISSGLNIIMPGFIILTLISIITIGSQTLKASLMNPVKSLKTE